MIAAAADALRDEILPFMGILTLKSQLSETRRLMPCPSLPMTMAAAPFEVRLVERRTALRRRAVNPDARLFERIDCRGNVGHARNRQIFKSARRCLADHSGQTHASALRNNDPVRACALRGADNRAEVMRVRQLVADHNQGSFSRVRRFFSEYRRCWHSHAPQPWQSHPGVRRLPT